MLRLTYSRAYALFPVALRSPFDPVLFCRDRTTRGSLKEQLQTAKDGLAAFKDVDVDKLQGKITELTGQLADKDKQWQEKLDGMAFDGRIKDAITAAKGRNAKAIAALLDTDKLRASKNQEADIKAALLFLNHHSFHAFAGNRGESGIFLFLG